MLVYEHGDINDINFIVEFMGVQTKQLAEGFTSLGFRLKPCGYKVADWTWMVDNFKHIILIWTHKWLSLGGRYILVQAVLMHLVVYWEFILLS